MTFPVYSASSGCYIPTGKKLTNSLRTRNSANGYLNRTPASASNRQTWTYSAWVKRGLLGASTYTFFYAGSTSAGQLSLQVYFSGDTLSVLSTVAGVSNDLYLTTTQVFRDPSAWYHIVIAVDTTQATASNRAKIYVNGTQVTSFTNSTYPAQNYQTALNNTVNHNISNVDSLNIGASFDGYTAELNVIDGQALSPTSFGQFDPVTGVWVPVNYTGTYGTNGFYLPFTNTTSATTLGYDFSGNGNNWTPNNISTTAGSTYDAMTDVPTLTNTNDANYAVLNPLDLSFINTGTNSNGNLSVSGQTGSSPSTIYVNSGKYYFEASFTSIAGITSLVEVGIRNGTSATGQIQGYRSDGQKDVDTSSSAYGATYTTGDVIGCAFNLDANQMTFFKNGVSQGSFTFTTSDYYAACMIARGTTTFSGNINFGQQPFTYTPPAGFLPLNTFNLPCPTIWNGANVMAATLYTGNGSTQTISNAANNTIGKTFKPDLVWIKDRTSAQNNVLTDSVRGPTLQIQSNTSNLESTNVNGLTAFGSTGFTVGSDAQYNNNTDALVAWQWNAGSGTTSSNTNGSLTSTTSVNPTAGFSVVTYTGNGAASQTVGHGLGVAPSMVIVKARNVTLGPPDWAVWHTGLPSANYTLKLDTTDAQILDPSFWGGVSPTSSVFTVGAASLATNWQTGYNYVAYCWAAIPGYSAFGSYTGNGSADGTFIYTGFRPRFFMVKGTTTTSNWAIVDSSRVGYNANNNQLYANLSNAEDTGAIVDILSNGFKWRSGTTSNNVAGATYIYAAFCENPFKYSLAR